MTTGLFVTCLFCACLIGWCAGYYMRRPKQPKRRVLTNPLARRGPNVTTIDASGKYVR